MAAVKTALKAAGATAVGVGPIIVKELAPQHWTLYWTIGYGLIIFLASLKLFQPDRRFLTVREPAVKGYLKKALESAPPNSIRANIYVPRWSYGFRCLVPMISYNASTAHADYGKNWWRGRGMCWQVYESGRFGICRKGTHSPQEFGMKRADILATNHVEAVFCVPLRGHPKSGGEDGVSGKVHAVLAYDALCAEGAAFLEQQHDLLLANKNRPLLELVEAISMYF